MNDFISGYDFKKLKPCPEYFWSSTTHPNVLQEKELAYFQKALSAQKQKGDQHSYIFPPNLKIITSKGIVAQRETNGHQEKAIIILAQICRARLFPNSPWFLKAPTSRKKIVEAN